MSGYPNFPIYQEKYECLLKVVGINPAIATEGNSLYEQLKRNGIDVYNPKQIILLVSVDQNIFRGNNVYTPLHYLLNTSILVSPDLPIGTKTWKDVWLSKSRNNPYDVNNTNVYENNGTGYPLTFDFQNSGITFTGLNSRQNFIKVSDLSQLEVKANTSPDNTITLGKDSRYLSYMQYMYEDIDLVDPYRLELISNLFKKGNTNEIVVVSFGSTHALMKSIARVNPFAGKEVALSLGDLTNTHALVDVLGPAENGHHLYWDDEAEHWTHRESNLNQNSDVNYAQGKISNLGYLRWDSGQSAFVEAKAYITDTLGGDYIMVKTTYTGGSVIAGQFSYDLTAKKLRLAKTSMGVFGDGGATAIHRPHLGDILTFRKEYASDSNIKFRVLSIVDIGGPDWNIGVQLIGDNDVGVSGDYYIYTMEKHSADKWIFNINPTPTNDFANGYLVGDLWINTALDTTYICVDNTTGSAIWKDVSNSGLNVGAGAKVYKDTTGDGVVRFRTITNSDSFITINELTDTIDLNINALNIPSTLGELNDVTLSGLAKEDLLVYDVGTSSWVNKPVEDIGLVSNGINLGSGEGVFVDKDNLTLRFKSVSSSDGSLKVTTTLDNEIDLSVDNSVLGFVTDGANIGKGEGIFTTKLDGVLQFKNLLSADGIVTIDNSKSGTDIEFGFNPLAVNISQFSDMNITLPIAEGELLFANGTIGKWENRLPVLNDMSDVDTGKVTTDDILIFNGSNWTAASKDIYFGNTYGHTYNYFNTAPVGDVTNGNLHLDGTTIYISTIDQYGKDLQVSGSFPFININNILVFQQANNAFVYMKIFPDNLTRAGTPPNTYWTGQVIIGSDDSVNLNVGFTGRLTCQPVHIKHLNDIEDVNIGKSDISDYLGWDDASGKWINRRVNLNDIVDVTTTGPQVGDYIRYSGTTWENTPFPMGSMYWRNNATGTTITTQKTILTDNSNFYKVAGTSILKLSTLFDMPANNRIRYLGSDRHFHVVCQFSAVCATNDRIGYFTLVKNEGTTPEYDNIIVSTNLHSDRDNGNAIHTDIMLLANDTLSLYVANTETSDSITIKFMYLYLMGM